MKRRRRIWQGWRKRRMERKWQGWRKRSEEAVERQRRRKIKKR